MMTWALTNFSNIHGKYTNLTSYRIFVAYCHSVTLRVKSFLSQYPDHRRRQTMFHPRNPEQDAQAMIKDLIAINKGALHEDR